MQNKVEIAAHSIDDRGNELLSVLVTFPRIILAEVNTHRMLSKNTSSSRAIPFNKMLEAVEQCPFIPIAFQKNHKGMQGTEYHTDDITTRFAPNTWLKARDKAIEQAKFLNKNCDVTKQLANRLLEPFMWTTMLITGPVKGGWDNFFNLRCPQYRVGGKGDIKSSTSLYKSRKDAIKDYPNSFDEPDINWLVWNEGQGEIHIMDLAEKIYDALNESKPKELQAGDYHIPFEDKITGPFTFQTENKLWTFSKESLLEKDADVFIPMLGNSIKNIIINQMIKISVSMSARTSYTVFEGAEVLNEKHFELYERLLNQEPPHSSPMEHVGKCMTDREYISYFRGELPNGENLELTYSGEHGWCRNFKGFIPLRHIIENEKTN